MSPIIAKSSGLTTRFPLGRLIVTEKVKASIIPRQLIPSLCSHGAGDWLESEKIANEYAIVYQTRIVSQHFDRTGKTFYIITSADRSETTVMLPDEY